jgi:aminomuconate-semialdehyde/2-hydroxymuconate-6-semialdehyde dehydrogenase
LAEWVERNFVELVRAETDDNGKTLRQSRTVDIPRVSTNFRFFASMAQTWSSESYSTPDAIHYTLRQPLGPVACISPWNLPLYLFSWKVAPALAAGNCVIGKPSEVTPLTAYILSRGIEECGWPPGVFNIVHGRGPSAGEALVTHPGIRAVSFTGGTKTGSRIASLLAPRFVKTSLELGGKNPNLIFADCDYERMLDTTVRSSFSNQGQICLCGSRILVQRSIYDRFRDDLVNRAASLVVGDPLDEKSDLGAVVSRPHMEKILGCIEVAKQEGGKILIGGQRVQPNGRCRNGYFVAPTVIEGLGPNCQTNQEEIFGPVVTLQPFDDVNHAIELANATRYGLSASVWTKDTSTALACGERIAAGVVWVNSWLVRDLRTPFGGVRQSGIGREGGVEAMRFFTDTKSVCLQRT